MARKFFNDRVYNTKRTIINLVIIGICIIGVIICFIITSNFEAENQNASDGILSIKKEVTIEVNDNYSNEIFFSKVENVDLSTIKIEYPENFNISKPGLYEIKLNINEKIYSTTLNIIDTTKPNLTLKELTIAYKDTYSVKDFIESCDDNSKDDCSLEFYKNGIDQDGNPLDYANYKDPGNYVIKISATDKSGNQTIKETKLIIGKDNNQTENPITCKYGNNEYNTNDYLIAIDITSNKCAVSLDLYKDSTMTNDINKLMENETTKIKKDVESLNLDGTLALNRKITAIVNNSGDGIVGYELRMTVSITHSKESNIIADYKVNSNGKRIFITNPYKIAS